MHYTERATLCLITGVFLCCLLQTTCGGDLTDGAEGATAGTTVMNEPLTAAHKEKIIIINPDIMSFMHNTDSPPNQTVESGYDFLPASPGEAELRSDYPSDLFAIDDLRRGWVILHIIGIVYMSISLVIVCSEFFVPSLWVIQDKLSISDDVTGATFMAVGRSVPRQFSLLIGAFFGPASVGFGSLVGAAVFKILFVIGISTLLSRKVLQLTRWPFFRDMSFYLLSLVLLIVFLLDNLITWWESSMLLTVYILYVILLKFNAQVSQALKTQLHENSIQDVEPEMVVTSAAPGLSEDPDRSENVVNGGEQEGKGKPLSLKWPERPCQQAVFLFLLPITFTLWLTLPDVRNLKSERFVAVTFLGSVVWIHVFSYLTLWWAHRVGETFSIPEVILGLTVVAMGTSIPDLITSGIVARRGRADMLVSGAAGCNIFDVTVGLPLPWLLYSVIHSFTAASVSSSGLVCASVLLFLVLVFFITSVASCKWQMSWLLGLAMVFLYFVFVAVSLMMQFDIVVCPVG